MASIQQGGVNNGFQTLVKLFRFQSASSVSSNSWTRHPRQPLHDGFCAIRSCCASTYQRRHRRIADPDSIGHQHPGMTGLELLPKAKAARPDVPVIMITAYGDTGTRRKALEGGAEALLTKPIDFEALRGEIDNRVAGAPDPGHSRRFDRAPSALPPTNGHSHVRPPKQQP